MKKYLCVCNESPPKPGNYSWCHVTHLVWMLAFVHFPGFCGAEKGGENVSDHHSVICSKYRLTYFPYSETEGWKWSTVKYTRPLLYLNQTDKKI